MDIGNTVKVVTDNQDVKDFLETYGDKLVVTHISNTREFTAVNLESEVICPYLISMSDVVEVEDTHYTMSELCHCEEVAKCKFCEEFYPTYELHKGYCDRCTIAIEQHM